MTKEEYAKKHGLRVRRATKAENAAATSAVGKTAKYVIVTDSGRKFWSAKGTMADLRTANSVNRSQPAKKPAARTAQNKQRKTCK